MDATKILIEEIQKNIPKGENVVKYLTWKLGISKESAYRRMRGVVPFPLEEIRELAIDLNLSIDDIIRREVPNISENKKKKSELAIAQITIYQNFMDIVNRASQRSVIFSANRLILPFYIEYDALFELFFFNQIHRNQVLSGAQSFSEISISNEIQAIRKSIIENHPSFSQREYILDRNLFASITRKIQYFRRLKLISEKEVEILSHELLQILGKMETEMENGCSEKGEECFYYFSLLDIETNAVCVDCENKVVAFYWNFGMPVIQNNLQNYENKEWLESQKKYTILISQSSEFIRSEFIEQQKSFIEKINENKSFY